MKAGWVALAYVPRSLGESRGELEANGVGVYTASTSDEFTGKARRGLKSGAKSSRRTWSSSASG